MLANIPALSAASTASSALYLRDPLASLLGGHSQIVSSPFSAFERLASCTAFHLVNTFFLQTKPPHPSPGWNATLPSCLAA